MSDLLDRDNQHLLLQKPRNKENSFIEHVNTIAGNIQSIIQSNEYFNADVIEILEEVTRLDLYEAVSDLRKGNYLGNRKLDINLALNMRGITQELIENDPDEAELIWTDTSKVVLYDSATITFTDGVVVEMDFIFDEFPITISTHGDLLIQFSQHQAFLDKLDHTLISGFASPVIGEIVRAYDVIGSNSNLEKVVLHAVSGEYKEQHPVYYWAKTTSAFQTLSMRAGDIIKLGNEIDRIILLAARIDEVLELQSRLPELVDTYTEGVANGDTTIYNSLDILIELHGHLNKFINVYEELAKLIALYSSLGNLIELHGDLDKLNNLHTNLNGLITLFTNLTKLNTLHSKIPVMEILHTYITDLTDIASNLDVVLQSPSNALIASQKAAEALASANIATQKSDEIKNISAEAITGVAGSNALATYNPNNGKLTFVIPKGDKGDKGDAFMVNAVGSYIDRSLYDDRGKGFSFLAIDSAAVYFKLSNNMGDWSVGAPFGKGDKGDEGEPGKGILSIQKTGSTNNIDHYRINLTDGNYFDFDVINGPLDDSVTTLYAAWSGKKVNDILDTKLNKNENLNDLSSKSTARSNLGLGTAATKSTGIESIEIPLNEHLGDAAYRNSEDILNDLSVEDFILIDNNITAIKNGRYALLPGVVLTLPTGVNIGDTIVFKAVGSNEEILENTPMLFANNNKVHGIEEDDIAINGLGEVSLTWVGNDKGGWV